MVKLIADIVTDAGEIKHVEIVFQHAIEGLEWERKARRQCQKVESKVILLDDTENRMPTSG